MGSTDTEQFLTDFRLTCPIYRGQPRRAKPWDQFSAG